jgi:type IV secretion system protein VirB9
MSAQWLLPVVVSASLGTVVPRSAQSDSPLVASGARTISYHPRDLVPLHAKLRYTTLIVLPDTEDVVEVTCGDKEFWIVNAHGSLLSLKPTKAGSETNLHVLTTSGQVYAFLATEISDRKGERPDLTVYLDVDQTGPPASSATRPVKYVRAEQVEDFRAQAAIAREEARRATDTAQAQLDQELTTFRTTYPLSLVFPYRFKADAPPFFVHAMFHDDHVTYIQAGASELPALYELKDGAPNLVNFEVQHGTYVVPKILDSGYFTIGKQALTFRHADEYRNRK